MFLNILKILALTILKLDNTNISGEKTIFIKSAEFQKMRLVNTHLI